MNDREVKALQITAHIMGLVGPFITDEENDLWHKCQEELYRVFYETEAELVARRLRPAGKAGITGQPVQNRLPALPRNVSLI